MNVTYHLRFPNPHTHYVEVEMLIEHIEQDILYLKMPVWTPGSYLIREFQKNLDNVEILGKNNEKHALPKANKNTWIVETKNEKTIRLYYAIYCFEYSVRTNFVDDEHALINGASTFLYVDGNENTPLQIEIHPPTDWKNISTALPQKGQNKWIRVAENLDELIDSPIEIGNHVSYFFEAANVPHELAMFGKSNCPTEKLIADLKKIIEEEVKIFGSHPCDNYVFVIHHTDNSFGGLEHKNSSVNHIYRWHYDAENYQSAISLLAHEYFHLWNVKRIRPSSLIPYNYDTENYTDLLWFFEGVTSYYDDFVCYRAGVTERNKYLEIIENTLNEVCNTAGKDTQTLAQSSYDTWLKYYRRNENSFNAQINYYKQGAIVALFFDFVLMSFSDGKKSLDAVMKNLYADYLLHPNKGITEQSLLDTFNSISDISFTDLFQHFLHTTNNLNENNYFKLVGINLIDTNTTASIFLGLATQVKDGKLIITQLDKNYGAYQGGLNVHDEIIAIDGFRATKDYIKIYEHKKIGDTINVMVSRQGTIKIYTITLTQDVRKKYKIQIDENANEKQQRILQKWLG